MSAPENDFPLHVLKELESLFEEGRITTLAARASLKGPFNPAIKIIDSKTGLEFFEDRFPSQIQNKVAVMLMLLKKDS